MNVELKQHVGALAFGPAQSYRNITILPIVAGLNHSPDYLTLTQNTASTKTPHYVVNDQTRILLHRSEESGCLRINPTTTRNSAIKSECKPHHNSLPFCDFLSWAAHVYSSQIAQCPLRATGPTRPNPARVPPPHLHCRKNPDKPQLDMGATANFSVDPRLTSIIMHCMKWTDAIQHWQRLKPETRRQICWRRIPRQVALSMSFEREDVDLSWLEKLHHQGAPPVTSKPHGAS